MSRIEEALEKATRERHGGVSEPRRAAERPVIPVNLTAQVEVVEPDPLHLTENRLVVASAPSLGTSDAYRQLRATLMLAAEQKHLSFVVTSPLQGDGKSITALNLAYAVAQEIQLDAVVVDTDLRRPVLAKFLGIEGRRGVSDYLDDPDVTLDEVVVRLADGPLWVPAGTVRLHNTSELLGSRRMAQFCAELRDAFPEAIILFDSPPVLPAPDAMTLVQWLDGAIFVISAGKTSRRALTDAVRQFGANRIAGVVVNRSDRSSYGYGYGYRYYYGGYGYGGYGSDAGDKGGKDG